MQERNLCIGIAVLSFLTTLFVFLPALGSQFLLDEQFIAAWTKALLSGSAAGGWGSYLSWSGPDAQDAFGPIASLACIILSQMGAGLARLATIAIHAGCSVALYMVARRLTEANKISVRADGEVEEARENQTVSICISSFAALIFAVHPLSAELVSFIGAAGIELSILFFALAFYFYLSAHPLLSQGPEKRGKTYSILAIVFFICAYLAYSKSWYLIKIIAMFELLNFALDPAARQRYMSLWKDHSTTGRKRFLATLATLMGVSVALMCLEIFRGNDPIGSLMAMMPNGLRSMLLTLMFPINRSLWKKYSLEYITLYVVFSLAAALSAYGILRRPRYRVAVLTALAWVFFGLLIGGNQSIVADDFYGHRYLGHAQAGLSLLIAMMCFGLASALNEKRIWAVVPAALVCVTFMVASCRHSFNQTQHYKNAAKLLEKIQKSVKIVCAREKSSYCVAKDLPRSIAFVPLISPFHPVVLDGQNGLLRAPTVSGGPLKDALRASKMLNTCSRWDETFNALLPIVTEPKINDPPYLFDAAKIARGLNPPLEFWKTVSLDKAGNCLKIASNSEHEPGIGIFTGTLSPLDGDAFYVDARINTPVQPSNPNVELHWMTVHTGQYEKEDRRAVVKAKLNDNEYHRYNLSLRSTGWVTNGPPTQLTIGFPSSSTVELKGIGIIKDEKDNKLFAELKSAEPARNAAPGEKGYFCDLCFNYPDDADLGLFRMDKSRSEISFNFDASAITGSAKAILFSTRKDQLKLLSDCGEIPEDSPFKVELDAPKGTVKLGLDRFDKSGIYGIRLAAIDASGKTVGNFSDRIWLMVDKGQ